MKKLVEFPKVSQAYMVCLNDAQRWFMVLQPLEEEGALHVLCGPWGPPMAQKGLLGWNFSWSFFFVEKILSSGGQKMAKLGLYEDKKD